MLGVLLLLSPREWPNRSIKHTKALTCVWCWSAPWRLERALLPTADVGAVCEMHNSSGYPQKHRISPEIRWQPSWPQSINWAEPGYLQAAHGGGRCPGGPLRVSAALEGVGAAAADGRTGVGAAGARAQGGGQREQQTDPPGSHARHPRF